MVERIEQLRIQAEAEIAFATGGEQLEQMRVRHLGRRAELPQLLRGVAQLPPEERAAVGRAANEARAALEDLLARRARELASGEIEQRLAADQVDVTLPGAPAQPIGRLHLLTATR